MGIRQFANSVASILRKPHLDRRMAIIRHLRWQYLKAFDRFPFEQDISRSRIIAAHRRCGVSALIHSQGLYDYNNMNLVRLALAGGGTFFDVGANIGSYALLASECGRVRVAAFEPHPRTFELLRENVKLNARTNVQVFNVALGRREGDVWLTDEAGSAGNHLVAPGSARSIRVGCRRADMFCAGPWPRPWVVKIDVEGFEHDVLVGFGERLRSVDILLIETNGLAEARAGGSGEIHALLVTNGFQGPFRFAFDARSFYPDDQPSSEDSVYLADDSIDRWGLEIARHT